MPGPFQQRVLIVVRAIPRGRVLTYGQVALLIGAPHAARQVGRALYQLGPSSKIPWQRVINRWGGLSTYKIGTGELQRQLLLAEGVRFQEDGIVDLRKYQWHPTTQTIQKLRRALTDLLMVG